MCIAACVSAKGERRRPANAVLDEDDLLFRRVRGGDDPARVHGRGEGRCVSLERRLRRRERQRHHVPLAEHGHAHHPLTRVASPFGRAAPTPADRGRGLAHRARPRHQEPALARRLLADRAGGRRGLPALRALGARRLGAVSAAGLGLADPAARRRLPHDRALRALAPARRRAVRAAAGCVRDRAPEALDRALGDDLLALAAVGRRRGHDARLERRDPPLDGAAPAAVPPDPLEEEIRASVDNDPGWWARDS